MAKCISALAVVAALLGLSGYVGAGKDKAAVAKAVAQEKKTSPRIPQSRAEILAVLEEMLEIKAFHDVGEVTLEGTLAQLWDEVAKHGVHLPILVNTDAFKEEFPDAGDVLETRVRFPKFPRHVSVATALALTLSKIPTNNATYKVLRDRIEITTITYASTDHLLRCPVLASFKNKSLSEITHELSEVTGAPIVIDERVGAHKDKKITVAFYNDVSLQGALRLVTEQTGLSFVHMNSILVITTPERARELAEEKKQFIKERLQFLKNLNDIPLGLDRGMFDFMEFDQQLQWWMPATPYSGGMKKKVEGV